MRDSDDWPHNLITLAEKLGFNKVILQLDKFPIQMVEVNKDCAYEAAKLKGKYRIDYADCSAVALSVKLNASLVTGDPEFKKLKERISIQWIDLS